jgi:hypothetical protein
MAPPSITTTLATEEDALRLASVMTAGFAASDVAYPLIWGSAPEGTHDTIAINGLFTPVQKEGRVTFKAIDETCPKKKSLKRQEMGRKGVDCPTCLASIVSCGKTRVLARRSFIIGMLIQPKIYVGAF